MMCKYEIFKEKGWTYNPQTGDIYNGYGKVCKTIGTTGYIQMSTKNNGKQLTCKGHRFAYYSFYGYIDDNLVIDHIDRNPLNNKIDNLRLVSVKVNQFNRNDRGYTLHKKTNKYQSKIKLNGKSYHIGLYDTKDEAHLAYLEAKQKYHIFK